MLLVIAQTIYPQRFEQKEAFTYMVSILGLDPSLYVNEYLFRFENQHYQSYIEDEFETKKSYGSFYSCRRFRQCPNGILH
ncbi:MAG: hypothetical protein HC896_06805 [Bacteroidales bacterium]|nr:hypothetical protein [Bacteroidales bacterium]